MNKFEYKVIEMLPLYHISVSDENVYNYDIVRLNELGDEGWEVCAVNGNKYLLKRVIKQE